MPPWPLPDDEVLLALQRAYADGSWGKYDGPNLERLVAALGQVHGSEFVMPCCSGTLAVELALRGLGVGPGDEVILAGYDFPGNFRAVEAVGATPVLVDITARTWSLDAGLVEAALAPTTKAIVASHLHGGLVDMQFLREVADRRNCAIVEDACQAAGARVQDRVAGTWGDVGVLSFGGSKLLTSGRGGAMITNRPDVAQRAKVFYERGNHAFPLSELQAAVLVPQLAKLDERNALRWRNVQRLLERTAECALLQPLAPSLPDSQPSFYKLAWLFDASQNRDWTRERFVATIRAAGIALDTGFRGFTRRSANRCRRVGDLHQSELAAETTVLLHHPVLLEGESVIDELAQRMLACLNT